MSLKSMAVWKGYLVDVFGVLGESLAMCALFRAEGGQRWMRRGSLPYLSILKDILYTALFPAGGPFLPSISVNLFYTQPPAVPVTSRAYWIVRISLARPRGIPMASLWQPSYNGE
jgi:hypothetical protein